jgi:protein SCO1/2
MNTPLQRGFADRSIVLVLAAALAAGIGLFAASRYFAADAPTATHAPLPLTSVRLITPPRTLPNYSLAAGDGSTLTAVTLRGHWTLVFLGFTHCPDVCPTTLAELAKAQHAWQDIPEVSRPRVLFASVDPERDTPQKTAEYARYFHPETIAASGTAAQLAGFAQAMGLVYMKIPLANGDYSMDHSATLVLLDPQGRQAGLVRAPFAWKAIADDLRLLSGATP